MLSYPEHKISIALTTFNRWPYTERTLNHLFKHTPLKTEIIIIDNGSTDNTVQKLKTYIQNAQKKSGQRNIKIIENKKNLGIGRAVNLAFSQSKGDLLIKLDNDILVCRRWVYFLWLVYAHFKNRLGVCCLEVRDTDGRSRLSRKRTQGKTEIIVGGILFERTPAVNGATMAMSRSFWSRHKFSEDRLYGHEDARLAVKAWNKGLVCGQLRSPTTWVTHLQHDNRYRKYDLWKNHVAKIGRSFKFEAGVSCLPLEGDQIQLGNKAPASNLIKDSENTLITLIKKDIKEELGVELYKKLRRDILDDLKNEIRNDLREELKKIFTMWF